jgi:hypothetical protein
MYSAIRREHYFHNQRHGPIRCGHLRYESPFYILAALPRLIWLLPMFYSRPNHGRQYRSVREQCERAAHREVFRCGEDGTGESHSLMGTGPDTTTATRQYQTRS